MEITFDRKTVGNCMMQRFTLPTYQRDYRWETKHLQELLTDIQEEFLQNYDPQDGRSKVGEYTPYFLGTIITTAGSHGTRSIVDGQQRLTTLSIILAHFFRESKHSPDDKISDVEPLIRRKVFGASEFNIEFDSDRRQLFELLLDNSDLSGELLDEAVDSIENITESTREVYKIFTQVESFLLDDIRENLVPRFVDYLIERVYLFEIGVPSEQDGHKVFVTMNDRGLKLAPLDLLKGYLLSNISDAKANTAANAKWASCIRDLRTLGSDEDSTFFKTWLRAQYAVSARGKSRGDPAADFEIVGDAYHRWVVDNATLLGLSNSDDYYDLVERTIPFYVSQYKRLKAAEESLSVEFPHVFYNGSRNITLQYMAILSALDVNDSSAIVDKKIKIVSYYIDAYLTSRVITLRDNNYDNIKDQIFSLAKRIRRRSVSEIVNELDALMSEIDLSFSGIDRLSYYNLKRQEILHLLARFGSHLEDCLDITNKVGFDGYIDRTKGNRTFDVEHAVPQPLGVALGVDISGVPILSDGATMIWRNNLGALLLLPRGRNRSMRDMSYPDKLTRYASENVLAQSLTSNFYLNNPNVTTFISSSGLPIVREDAFVLDASQRRSELYKAISARLWNRTVLSELAA